MSSVFLATLATVVELADTRDLKFLGLTSILVQVWSAASKSIVKGIIVRLMIIPFLFYTEIFFYEMVHLGIENAQILCYIVVRKRLRYFNRCKEDNNGISKTDKRSNLLLVTRTYS